MSSQALRQLLMIKPHCWCETVYSQLMQMTSTVMLSADFLLSASSISTLAASLAAEDDLA